MGMTTLSGCTGSSNEAVVRVQKSAVDGSIEIVFEELNAEEQSIILTALNEEFYHKCSNIPKSVRSIADRINSQEAYMKYKQDTYALYISIADELYADTATYPDDLPNCGLF